MANKSIIRRVTEDQMVKHGVIKSEHVFYALKQKGYNVCMKRVSMCLYNLLVSNEISGRVNEQREREYWLNAETINGMEELLKTI
jgi:hypothetical protein